MKNSASGPQYDVVAMPVVAQVLLGLERDEPRVPRVGLEGERIVDVAGERQRRHLEHRIHERRRDVRQQQHVALVDRLEAADGRAVEAEPLLDHLLVQRRRGIEKCCQVPGQVAELHVHDLDVLLPMRSSSLPTSLVWVVRRAFVRAVVAMAVLTLGVKGGRRLQRDAPRRRGAAGASGTTSSPSPRAARGRAERAISVWGHPWPSRRRGISAFRRWGVYGAVDRCQADCAD